MKKIIIAKMLIIATVLALIFYNLGIAVTLKNLKPRAVNGGYEITLFDNVYFYED